MPGFNIFLCLLLTCSILWSLYKNSGQSVSSHTCSKKKCSWSELHHAPVFHFVPIVSDLMSLSPVFPSDIHSVILNMLQTCYNASLKQSDITTYGKHPSYSILGNVAYALEFFKQIVIWAKKY